jgi:hypothetical protein
MAFQAPGLKEQSIDSDWLPITPVLQHLSYHAPVPDRNCVSVDTCLDAHARDGFKIQQLVYAGLAHVPVPIDGQPLL